MLIYHEVDGNVQNAVRFVNDKGLSHYVLSMHELPEKYLLKCAIVFRSMSREDQQFIRTKLYLKEPE